jgi:hypothetical protein
MQNIFCQDGSKNHTQYCKEEDTQDLRGKFMETLNDQPLVHLLH